MKKELLLLFFITITTNTIIANATTTTTTISTYNPSVNLFISTFLQGLLPYFGGNILLLFGVFGVFLFGVVYALGLPRIAIVPLLVFAVVILAYSLGAYSPLFVIILSLVLAFFIYLIFGR